MIAQTKTQYNPHDLGGAAQGAPPMGGGLGGTLYMGLYGGPMQLGAMQGG